MANFCVITKVPNPVTEGAGNLAVAMPLYQLTGKPATEETGYLEPVVPVDLMLSLNLRAEVFSLGEIVVLDGGEREIGGEGRKPSKWFIEYETFDDIDAAIARSREVTEAESATQRLASEHGGNEGPVG